MEFENLQIEIPLNDESSPMFAAKIYVSTYMILKASKYFKII